MLPYLPRPGQTHSRAGPGDAAHAWQASMAVVAAELITRGAGRHHEDCAADAGLQARGVIHREAQAELGTNGCCGCADATGLQTDSGKAMICRKKACQ